MPEIPFEDESLDTLNEAAIFAYAGDPDVVIVEGLQDDWPEHGVNTPEEMAP